MLSTLALIVGPLLAAQGAGETRWTGPRVVISPAVLEGLAGLKRDFAFLPPPPYWTPSPIEVAAAERALARQLEPSAQSYGRQYLGLTIKGRRVLQVRGFCETFFPHDDRKLWEREPISLLDTASCAFQADFDVEAKRLTPIGWGTPGP